MSPTFPSLVLDFSKAPAVPGGLDAALRREWFLTNGLGGFASGTPLAIPQRRYHAWLIGALRPPVGRVVGLSSMVETVVLKPVAGATASSGAGSGGEQRIDFSSFAFPSNPEPSRAGEQGGPPQVFSPSGYSYLRRFEKDVACRWRYSFGPVDFVRELLLLREQNAAIIRYRVNSARHAVRLELRPLTALRDFHELVRCDQRKSDYSVLAGGTTCEITSRSGRLMLAASAGSFVQDRQWWFNFRYARDAERGQDCLEDIFSPGWFSFEASPGREQSVEILAILSALGERPTRPIATGTAFDAAASAERGRLGELVAGVVGRLPSKERSLQPSEAETLRVVVQAADQFVVRREKPVSAGPRAMAGVAPSGPAVAAGADLSVIAGYPWFSDWGRDTMISLPGLFIATGRLDEARRVLETFANLTRRGLIPNCFDNGSGEAEYNTVDASLWFLHAARALQLACAKCGHADPTAESSPIRRACLSIIEAYQTGTDFNIRMDAKDGLISAGDVGTQLTWMDAKRDGVVFTPRHGKPVEINALWYSGLMLIADMLEKDRPKTARELRQVADRAGRSFREQFWNASGKCLFDVLTPASGAFVPNSQIRPNQIFACSLPFSALDQNQKESVLAIVTEHLLTPRGLRTLSPSDPHYVARFEGPLFERDRAYHNGTVWPWLLGPYAEAVLRTGKSSPKSTADARKAIQPLLQMVSPSGGGGPSFGQIPEIYDGDDTPGHPRRPDGCFAQAWSVAECFRILTLLG